MPRCPIAVILMGLNAAGAAQPVLQPASGPAEEVPARRLSGYQGVWFGPGEPHPTLGYPFSGGLGTAPSGIRPTAVFDPASNRTFFVYAGAPAASGDVQHPAGIMLAFFDHARRTVPRPAMIAELENGDPRNGAAVALDEQGHLWLFRAAHEGTGPAAVYRSVRPRDIEAFTRVAEGDFSYPQVWALPGQGFLTIVTGKEQDKPRLFVLTSPDGRSWSAPQPVCSFGDGEYGISGIHKSKVGLAFTYVPPGAAAGMRTNLYYIETPDGGRTWQTIDRKPVSLPLDSAENPALVRDYTALNRRVFLQDLLFDQAGAPAILYILVHRNDILPRDRSRVWTTARWAISEWEVTGVLRSDHDADAGCLTAERFIWRLFAPTDPGVRPRTAGGGMIRWTSDDMGRSWSPLELTPSAERHHNYARHPLGARDDFYVFWADGDTGQPSASHLYFADKAGNVYVLPANMEGPEAEPQQVLIAPPPETQPAEGPPADKQPVGGSPTTGPQASAVGGVQK